MVSHDSVLTVSGRVALLALGSIYAQALHRGDLLANPDWTISHVMVYSYNSWLAHYILFPAFLAICVCYAQKKRGDPESPRVTMGSVVATVGGIGVIANPVTTHKELHLFFALVVFTASAFWYPQCSARQLQTFAVSAVFFLGGGAAAAVVANGIGEGGGARNKTAPPSGQVRGEEESEVGLGLLSFLPSVCCMAGELGILTTWGLMVQLKKGKVA